ncbi:hypothetical protein XENOCAPTIV_012323 [Xenoophorus captivus]|uniref:Secreted protein n=1 Tax=Xenoophorus captivus TaxID=1517983 RepID=A0ABV0S6I3_9TELE
MSQGGFGAGSRGFFALLTCVSDRFNCRASSVRSRPTTYWHRWNSSSSRYSCSAVKEVRVRLGRSRSRPLGKTISRMVPLASAQVVENTKSRCISTQQGRFT